MAIEGQKTFVRCKVFGQRIEGELVVRNLNYNDTGQCTCAAKNTLGSSEASGNLTVRSKKNIFFSYGKQPFKQGLLQANLAVLMASVGPCFMARLCLIKKNLLEVEFRLYLSDRM